MSLHGSHIDLGKIASAFSNGGSGSTATLNPMFNAAYNGDTEQWEDPNGNALADEHQKILTDIGDKGGDPYALTKSPYVTPTWSDKVFHPDVAKQENDYNNAWALQGPAAQHTQGVVNDVNTSQAKLAAPAGTKWEDMSPAQRGIATSGRFDNPSILAAQSAGADIAANTPLTNAEILALKNTSTKRGLISSLKGNLPEKESLASISGADAMTAQNNNAITTAQTAAPYIPKDIATMYGARIAYNQNSKTMDEGIAPSIPNKAALVNNQAQREVDAIPRQNQLYGSNLNTQLNDARVQEGLSGVAAENLAGLEAERKNQTLAQVRDSYHLPPPQNPIGVTPQGTLERNPLYAPMMQTIDAKLGTGGSTTQNGFSPQLASGYSIGPSVPAGQTNAPIGSSIASQLPVATNNTTLKDQWGANQKGVIAQGIAKSKEIEAVRQEIEEAHVTRNIKALNEATKRLNQLLGNTHANN